MRLGVLAAVLVSSAIAAGLVAKHVLMRLGQSKSLDGVLARVPDYLSAAVPSNPDLAPMRHFSGSAEGQMEIVYGKIREILPGIEGMMCGFVIDGGLEVNFPKDVAKRVSGVVALGSRLEICGHPFRGRSGEPRLDAEFITNLDLNRSINLHAAPPMDKPEVPSSSSPTSNEAAPLVPPQEVETKIKNSVVLDSRSTRDQVRPSLVIKMRCRPSLLCMRFLKIRPRTPQNFRTPIEREPRGPSSWLTTVGIGRRR